MKHNNNDTSVQATSLSATVFKKYTAPSLIHYGDASKLTKGNYSRYGSVDQIWIWDNPWRS